MAALQELQKRLNVLREHRASGILQTSYEGELVIYKSDAQMASAITDLELQIAALTRNPARTVVVGTQKGFC